MANQEGQRPDQRQVAQAQAGGPAVARGQGLQEARRVGVQGEREHQAVPRQQRAGSGVVGGSTVLLCTGGGWPVPGVDRAVVDARGCCSTEKVSWHHLSLTHSAAERSMSQ